MSIFIYSLPVSKFTILIVPAFLLMSRVPEVTVLVSDSN